MPIKMMILYRYQKLNCISSAFVNTGLFAKKVILRRKQINIFDARHVEKHVCFGTTYDNLQNTQVRETYLEHRFHSKKVITDMLLNSLKIKLY